MMSEDTELNEGTLTEGGEGEVELDAATVSEASEQGWVPREQWHGHPEQWVPADEFVRRGREIMPILRKNLSQKDQKIAQLEAKIAAQDAKLADIDNFRGNLEKTIYQRAIDDVKAQIRLARSEGDTDALADAEERLEELRASPPKKGADPATPTAPQTPPAVAAWIASNPWYNTNPDLAGYMNGVVHQMTTAAQMRGEVPDPATILAQATLQVRRQFAARFGGPANAFDGGSPSGGGRPASGGGGKGFNSLPADAKAVFARLYRDGTYGKAKLEDAQQRYYSDYNS